MELEKSVKLEILLKAKRRILRAIKFDFEYRVYKCICLNIAEFLLPITSDNSEYDYKPVSYVIKDIFPELGNAVDVKSFNGDVQCTY